MVASSSVQTVSEIEQALDFTLAPFQKDAFEAFTSNRDLRSILINAPTGSGKSLAAFLAAMSLTPHSANGHFLWVTPLKSLARDLQIVLNGYSQQIGLGWEIGLRSGDSKAAEKKKQLLNLPTGLITTPESLSLLLTYPEMQEKFSNLSAVVVDEWHELLSSKRGVQTELCLSRLQTLSPNLKRIGLSATIGNLDEALDVLHGTREGTQKIIRSTNRKNFQVTVLSPLEGTRFPWAGHLGITLAPSLLPKLYGKKSLIFTNTRFQAERWFQELLVLIPDLKLALHHGSLDRDERARIEGEIKNGTLDAVVCTSSLDLGVDFPPVDQVVQIGSPRSVARALQRAGRSGHQPGAQPHLILLPTNQWELSDFYTLKLLMERDVIEVRRPLTLCYDLLAQHLCTLALGGGFNEESAFKEIRTCNAFKTTPLENFNWVVNFIVSGGNALKAYENFRRVQAVEGRFIIENKKMGLLHRLSIGTITSWEAVSVQFAKGGYIGQVEERFIAALKPGDNFIFSGKSLELIQFRDMKALVRIAKKPAKMTQIPSWEGGKMPFSVLVGGELLKTIEDLQSLTLSTPDLFTLRKAVEIQLRWSILPNSKQLLIESILLPDEHHLFVYPFLGRQVHEGLALLIAKRMSDLSQITINYAINDYGINLFSADPFTTSAIDFKKLLTPENIEHDISAAMNMAELVKRHFREVARVAGLIFQGYPGKSKTTKQLNMSSSLLFDVLKKYDPGNLLVQQAQREVLELKLESPAIHEALTHLQKLPIKIVELARLTPLSFGLWAERLQSKVSSESYKTRIEKAVRALEKEASR